MQRVRPRRTGIAAAALVAAVAAVAATVPGIAVATAETVAAPRALARSTVDRPDDQAGYQVHVLYVLPSDGVDRGFDVDGTLERSVAAWNGWLAGQTGGPSMRLDTAGGVLDIGFARLSRPDAQIAASGAFVRDELERDLASAGWDDPAKLYAVYYDGGSTFSCGSGAWPPTLVGDVAAIFLRGTPPGAPPCASNVVGASSTAPGYFEFAMLHEIVHDLGFVAACTPHHVRAGHTSDDPRDLMWAGDPPLFWQPSILDVGRDDYFGHHQAGCADLQRSAFLTPLPAGVETPVGWPTSPSGLAGTALPGRIDLSWGPASTGTAAVPVTSYVVTASPGGHAVVVAAPATSATVTGLTDGTTYHVTVSAVTSSRRSPPAAATVAVPAPPVGSPAPPVPLPVPLPVPPVVTPPVVPLGSLPRPLRTAPPTDPGDVRNCTDFDTWEAAALWFWDLVGELGDVARLDPDADLVPCEGLVGAPATARLPSPVAGGAGYWMVDAAGGVHGFGDAFAIPPVVTGGARAVAPAPGGGYWVLTPNGDVQARFAADLGGVAPGRLAPGESVASIAGTPDGSGYWVFTDRGRALTFGAAGHFGDMAGVALNGPIVASTVTPSGRGYWMVASDGGIFSFGDAVFHGSTGALRLNEPVVGIAADPDGTGYWLVASDGGNFAFDAPFRGSVPAILAPDQALQAPVVGAIGYGDGYLMVGADGGIFSFSDQPFLGSLGAGPPSAPVIGTAVVTR